MAYSQYSFTFAANKHALYLLTGTDGALCIHLIRNQSSIKEAKTYMPISIRIDKDEKVIFIHRVSGKERQPCRLDKFCKTVNLNSNA